MENLFDSAREKQKFFESCAMLAWKIGDQNNARRYLFTAYFWAERADNVLKGEFGNIQNS